MVQRDPRYLPDTGGERARPGQPDVHHDGQGESALLGAVNEGHSDAQDSDGKITEQEFIRASLEDPDLVRMLSIRT